MLRIFAAILTIALAGCVSQALKSWIGQPIERVIARNGPPTHAFDVHGDRRAFQWVQKSSYTTPAQAWTTNTGYSSHTSVTGGQTYTSECHYTLYAEWDSGIETWVVSGFEPPGWC